jgi:predicted PurR-regulated permease PerM
MQEIADHLNRHLTAGVADKEMESAKIDPTAQNSLNGERLEVESAQIETESKGQTLGSRMVDYVQSLSATLVALAALSLLGLFFFVARVTAVFSGGRKSVRRQRRR